MGKRVVFCCDGTWQTPLSGTNVYKLYKGLTVTADQVTYYDDGVGADATGFDKLIEGAIGEGLVQKILDCYTKIAHVYEEGDEIFLFGFSRGAYTARSLAGFIASCGLPTGTFDDSCVTTAFKAYRDPVNRASILAGLAACGLGDAIIQLVGVWDTVGSMGIPAIFGGFDEAQFGFLDTTLHPDVKNACQCLSIDEQRRQFPATLWSSAPAAGQTIEQVWFSGCHGDVGGGTAMAGGVDEGTRLCDITLGWMVAKALEQKLTMDPTFVTQYGVLPSKFALDAIRQSWTAVYGPPLARPVPADSKIGNSVALRVQYGAGDYLPPNLTLSEGAVADSYAVVNVVDEDSF
jgi:uncharacterized protein (DUF2235 family)